METHQTIHGYKYTKIQGPRFQRNYIIDRDQKSDFHGTSFQSSPKINRMIITSSFAYNESLQNPTIAVLIIKVLIFFRPLSNVHLFQSNQRFGKALNLIFPSKLSSQNKRGFDHATILSPSFHGLRKEHLAQWPPLFCPKYDEKRVEDYEPCCLRKQE